MNITINSPKDINRILSLIHDEWFDKNDIKFIASSVSLEIKLKRKKYEDQKIIKRILFIQKLSFPIVESILRINYVDNYQIEDTANIGSYDFNEIKYDEKGKEILITSGFPLIIKIKVREFAISLEDTDRIIEQKSRWSI